MIALVFLATVINYLDRQTLSVVAPVLREEFHMSNVTYSRVVSAFMLAYTISNGFSGTIIDKLGTRAGYALCIAWWSVAAILHAFATGAWSLGAARFLLGLGEAGNWPAGVKVVSEWFPERERALAAGMFNSGSSFGAILAPPIVAFITLQFGWAAAFAGVGVTGLVWLVFWWKIYHTPAEPGDAGKPGASGVPYTAAPVERPEVVAPWVLFRARFVWTFMLSKIFLDPVWYFYIFWFPEYLKNARQFDLAAIGKYAWIPFLVAGLGNIMGGALSGALLRRGWSVTYARKTAITAFTLLMLSAIPAVLTADVRLSIAFVSIAMVGYTGSLANTLAFPADVFPRHLVGSVWGLASMGAGFGGMIFALITGWVVDHYSYVPVFFGFAFLPLISAAIVWTMLGPLTPDSYKPAR